jgi:hypothetical protein
MKVIILGADDPRLEASDKNEIVITSEQDRQIDSWVEVLKHLLAAERAKKTFEAPHMRLVDNAELRSLSDLPVPAWPLRTIICQRIEDSDFTVFEHNSLSNDLEQMCFVICRKLVVRPFPDLEQFSRSQYPPRRGY